MDHDDLIRPSAPKSVVDALDRGRADVAVGRVVEVDVDALCRDIEAEAATLANEPREAGRPSAG